MIKSNDNLLCHIIATDEMQKGKIARYKTDETHSNPTQLKVSANEVVYLHFIHVKSTAFNLDINTATKAYTLDQNNTINGSFNTIVRCLSDIKFNARPQVDYVVQLVRIQY